MHVKAAKFNPSRVTSHIKILIKMTLDRSCRPRPRDHRDAQKGVLLRPADGGVGWAAARFFPTKALRRLKPHNNSVPTEEGAKPGLAGLFYLLEEIFFSSQRTKIAQFIMPCLPLLPPTL